MMKLVCAVGTGKYEETTYRFGDVKKNTKFAPIAIGCCAMKPKEDLELVALLTDEAEKMHGEQLKMEAEDEGWAYTKVGIPAGRLEGELWEIFDAFGRELKQGDEIVLDLTHGFRHVPALLLSATQYYTVRKDLSLLGIFYGAYDAPDENNVRPIFDLTPLYDLSEWTYGVRLLRDYQFPAALGEMLDKPQDKPQPERSEQPRHARRGITRLEKLGRSLKELETPLVSGIPLESGFEAHEALKNARDAEDELKDVPPMKELWRELEEQLESFGLEKPSVPRKQRGQVQAKERIYLTQKELKRQSQLIGGYLESGNLWATANLLREWMVSTVIFHSSNPENWLNRDRRHQLEGRLGTLLKWNSHQTLKHALTKDQRTLIGLWDKIAKLRNALAPRRDAERNDEVSTGRVPPGVR